MGLVTCNEVWVCGIGRGFVPGQGNGKSFHPARILVRFSLYSKFGSPCGEV